MTTTSKLPSISLKVLALYVDWQLKTKHIPKSLRYSMGIRIETILATMIESIASAYYSEPHLRTELIMSAITKNDTLKFMFYALFELKGLDQNTFLSLSQKVEEVGKMLYGWKNQIKKQNHQFK
ncbi:MAG: four helix bundle protein [Candidatus Taylorbacteria bacterium]